MPSFNIRCTSSFSTCLFAKGSRRGLCLIGGAVPVLILCSTKVVWPKSDLVSAKLSLKLTKSSCTFVCCSAVRFFWQDDQIPFRCSGILSLGQSGFRVKHFWTSTDDGLTTSMRWPCPRVVSLKSLTSCSLGLRILTGISLEAEFTKTLPTTNPFDSRSFSVPSTNKLLGRMAESSIWM